MLQQRSTPLPHLPTSPRPGSQLGVCTTTTTNNKTTINNNQTEEEKSVSSFHTTTTLSLLLAFSRPSIVSFFTFEFYFILFSCFSFFLLLQLLRVSWLHLLRRHLRRHRLRNGVLITPPPPLLCFVHFFKIFFVSTRIGGELRRGSKWRMHLSTPPSRSGLPPLVHSGAYRFRGVGSDSNSRHFVTRGCV